MCRDSRGRERTRTHFETQREVPEHQCRRFHSTIHVLLSSRLFSPSLSETDEHSSAIVQVSLHCGCHDTIYTRRRMPQKIVRFARAKHRGNASKISRYDRAVATVILSLSVSLRCTRQRVENFIETCTFISHFIFHFIEYDDTVVQRLNLRCHILVFFLNTKKWHRQI